MKKHVLLLVFLVVFGAGCGVQEKDTNADTQKQNESISQDQPIQPQQVQEKGESNKDSQLQIDQNVIPGIAAADVKLNLQKFRFKFTGPRPIQNSEEYLDDGEATDPDTDAELSCTITANSPTKIKYLTFRADGVMVAGQLPSETFLALSKGFLGYTATLPYNDSNPEKAREWVENNIAKVNQPGKPVTTVIGSVKYTLSGGKYLRILSMKPKDSE